MRAGGVQSIATFLAAAHNGMCRVTEAHRLARLVAGGTAHEVDADSGSAGAETSDHEGAAEIKVPAVAMPPALAAAPERCLVTHLTPKRFLDLVDMFKSLLRELRAKLKTHCGRLSRGVSILKQTAEQVESMQVHLHEAEAEVTARITSVNKTREELSKETAKVDREAELAELQAAR